MQQDENSKNKIVKRMRHGYLSKFFVIVAVMIVAAIAIVTGFTVQAALSDDSIEYTTKDGEWVQVDENTYTIDKDADGDPDITLIKNGDTWKYYFTVADSDAQYYAYEDGVPDGYEVVGQGTRADPAIINGLIALGEKKYSHTSNVDDNGTQISSTYGDNQSKTEVITIPGAKSLKITITYQTESTSYDWVCIWAGNYPSYTASNNYGSSISGKLGGSKRTLTYTVDGDTATIGFRSDGSACSYYGYYAVVEGMGKTEPVITNKDTTNIPGGFTLTKQVSGSAADVDKNFRFDIALSAEKESLQKYVDGSHSYGEVMFDDGVGTVYLKANETIQVGGLPAGVHWNITELNADDYDTSWTVDDETGEPVGVVAAGVVNNVVCLNVKNAAPIPPEPIEPPKTGGLTVMKTVVNGDASDVFDYHMVMWGLEPNTEYNYLKGDDSVTYQSDDTGIADFTFQLKDTEHIDFNNLPVGTKYQVIEEANEYEASYRIENGTKVVQEYSTNAAVEKELSTAKETIYEDDAVVVHFTNTKYTEPEIEVKTVAATVEKVWDDENDIAKLRPDSVTVYLLQGYENDDDSFNVIDSVVLSDVNSWKSVFGNLYKTNDAGDEYVYKFQEVSVQGYETTIDTVTSDTTISSVITNKVHDVGNLKISKSVTGDDADTNKNFLFTIKASKDDIPVTGVYSLDGEAGTKTGSVVFDDSGVATLTLKDNESAVIPNLPAGTSYVVTESKYADWIAIDGYEYTGTIEKNNTDNIAVTNEYTSTQSMTISKEVTGSFGNRIKSFNFELKLTGDKVPEFLAYTKGTENDYANGEYDDGKLNVVDGVVSFSLKHEESITFPKIPNGVSYEVTELNGDSYIVTYENPDGTIDHEDVNVKVVNERNLTVPTNVNPIVALGVFISASCFGIVYFVFRCKKKTKLSNDESNKEQDE